MGCGGVWKSTKLTGREDAAEDAGRLVEGGAVPALVAELVLALVDAHLGAQADGLAISNDRTTIQWQSAALNFQMTTIDRKDEVSHVVENVD